MMTMYEYEKDPLKGSPNTRYQHTGAVYTWKEERRKKRPTALGKVSVNPGTTNRTIEPGSSVLQQGRQALWPCGEGDGNATGAAY